MTARLSIVTSALVVLLSLATGCVTAETAKDCVQLDTKNCVGTNVKQICEVVDGCKVCRCEAPKGALPAVGAGTGTGGAAQKKPVPGR